MKRIVCFHLLNDYSGSPKVLKTVLEGLLKKGFRVDLVSSGGGVLDELGHPGLKRGSTYRYRFSANPAITMLRYAAVQIYTFFIAFRWMFCKDAVFYINTLLPVGPALAGRIMRKRVVYHYHENAFVKGGFYRALAWMMQKLADEIICVSACQASFLKRRHGVTVIPNALPEEFVSKLRPDSDKAFERKTVLMLSSLKEYKGTREFILLSGRLPEYKFVLVINDTQENTDKYLNSICPGRRQEMAGLAVFPRQEDVSGFYNSSSLVINLTNPRLAIETFGLTALEAMSAGLPVIVPTAGGIAEMVEDGVNGYKIDVQNLDGIEACIRMLLSDRGNYLRMAADALKYSRSFSSEQMTNRIAEILK